jgi:hypothetical protein
VFSFSFSLIYFGLSSFLICYYGTFFNLSTLTLSAKVSFYSAKEEVFSEEAYSSISWFSFSFFCGSSFLVDCDPKSKSKSIAPAVGF